MGGDDTIPAPQIDGVGVDVGCDGVEVVEQQGGSGVDSGGVEDASVGSDRQSVDGVGARPCTGDGGALPG